MTRHLVDLPEDFHFKTNYRIVYSDINAANHLGADRVLPIALEAQFGFVRSLGYDDAIVFENAGLIMANSQIDYLAEARYGDELEIKLGLSRASDKGMNFVYQITRQHDDCVIARVKTLLLFFDYSLGKVTRIPQGFLDRLAERDICI